MTGWLLLTLIVGISAQAQNILDVLKTRRETTLLHYLQQTGLDSTLNGNGQFTVFAPSESAFLILNSNIRNQWKNDTTALTNSIKYHIVAGTHVSSELMVNEKMLDTLSGQKIRVNYYLINKVLSVEGVKVTTSLIASNGVVHIVDHVLMPPNGTIADIIASHTELSALQVAVDAAGLTGTLTEGPYTLLAPSNTAFRHLGNDTVHALLAKPDLLKSILLYHVIHGTLYRVGMHSGSLHTLEENDREHLISSGVYFSVDGTFAGKSDISATNGVIHEIDKVLIPSSLRMNISSLHFG